MDDDEKISLAEARRQGKIDRFIAEREEQSDADWQQVRRERIRNAVHRPYTPQWRKQQRAVESMG